MPKVCITELYQQFRLKILVRDIMIGVVDRDYPSAASPTPISDRR